MPKVPQKYAKSSKIRLFSPIFPFFDPTDAIFLFDFWPKNRFAAQAIDFFDFFFEKFRFPPIFGQKKPDLFFHFGGSKIDLGSKKKNRFSSGFFSIFGQKIDIFFDFFRRKNSIFFRQKIDIFRFLGSKMDIFFRFRDKIHFRWRGSIFYRCRIRFYMF